MRYFAQIIGSDLVPFEMISEKGTAVVVREMKAERDPNWKPELVAGGFLAHCVNQKSQQWVCTSDEAGYTETIRMHKNGKWFSADGSRFMQTEEPTRHYDYNF